MSKELTEQYRDGTLKCGFYYFTNGKDIYPIDHRQIEGVTGVKSVSVVDKVPDYHDLCELKQELEICKDDKADLYAKLCNALMQLKEANKIIKKLYKESGNPIGCDYLEKWGVK